MKLKLEFNNTTKNKFSKKFFQEIFSETLHKTKIDCLNDKELEISLALVDEKEIEKLNILYRKKKKPTDVLSFCEYDNLEDICNQGEKDIFLGELIVCPEYITKISNEEKEPVSYSLKYIVSHGILHLLGFPHGKRMFFLQKAVADELEK
jgi:probable rRNA maturation factor